MDRSEPTLVPEWLRTTGSVNGGGNLAQHFASSSSHTDGHFSAHSTKQNRSSRSVSDKDISRRNSSSNGSSKHPYSSFSRSHRDKSRDKDKDRSAIGNHWDHDDPLGDVLISRPEKDMLRRSNSLVYRKPEELLPRRVDSKNGGRSNHSSTNGVLPGSKLVRSTPKSSFDKDFPSLGTGEKQGVPDIGRVPSPSSTTAVQCLPFVNPGLIGGEGWTSALAEVPAMIGSNSMSPKSVQQSVITSHSSGSSSPVASLNMAEALSQAPSRAHTTLQLPDKAQRLEELAIKQSKQLIPVLSSDKSKPKTAARTNETMVGSKSAQQQQQMPLSSQLANHSLHGGQVRSDTPRSSPAGKFLVLKPGRENGVSAVGKDVSSPIDNASRVVNCVASAAPPMLSSASLKSPKNSNRSSIEGKVAVLSLNSGSSLEKKSSQARSRSDFFDLMRRKTSSNTSAVLSPPVEKCGESVEGASSHVSSCVSETGSEVTDNGDSHEGEKDLCLNGTGYPDEEEAAFLRSLGWEENAGEEDGLTEEEINAFYEECMKTRPSLKLCRGLQQPKLAMLPESPITGSSRASPETEA